MANPIQLQKNLKGVNYPASKQDLVTRAKQNGADEQVLNQLNKLPDKEYSGPDQVTKAMF
ncbi:MAG: hypothetical protein JWR32_2200 [Mycobacterium sp.]|jgi:hypothetical protein|nr:hypothetical protein [Mycobacterium sp.]